MLFHYDGLVTEWDQYEWSKQAIHISVKKQTKWYIKFIYFFMVMTLLFLYLILSFNRWYAKRFLHPDIVAAYEYIFIWDEDLGVEHFNADKYFSLSLFFMNYSFQ